jgi:hypothetical protein
VDLAVGVEQIHHNHLFLQWLELQELLILVVEVEVLLQLDQTQVVVLEVQVVQEL